MCEEKRETKREMEGKKETRKEKKMRYNIEEEKMEQDTNTRTEWKREEGE